MANVVRSGVTFNEKIYFKLDDVVKKSVRYKIDKSEIVNAILSNSRLDSKSVQKMVMDWREKNA